MKKILLITATLLLISATIFAEKRVESTKPDGSDAVGSIKAGVVLGYPSGLTIGFRTSDVFEINAHVSSHYSDLSLGANVLFTLVDINISEEIFPLSIGPAVNINIPFLANVYYNGAYVSNLNFDFLGMVRWEYSFKNIPLNLFIEGGLGLNVAFRSSVPLSFTGSSAFGIRYIF